MDKSEQQIIAYIRAHWPSEIPPKWRIADEAYPKILAQIIQDLTPTATKSHQLFRLAGQSGSGKTSQLLPATQSYFKKLKLSPILIAARSFVPYHPFAKAIATAYGPENLRTKTNDSTTILMFLTLKSLIAQGYDIILDVAFLDPLVESALMQILSQQNYTTRCTMVALSKEISDQFVDQRKQRLVDQSTSSEFWRTTHLALAFYAKHHPKLPIIVWSAWDLQPIYSGPIGNPKALSTIKKYQGIPTLPLSSPTPNQLRLSKITYLENTI